MVLSREEVRQILAAVRIPLYRACLKTIYACGLRLLEGSRLQVPDVDSARMLLHIHGKSKGSLRTAARAHPAVAARLLAHASFTAVVVPGAYPARFGA